MTILTVYLATTLTATLIAWLSIFLTIRRLLIVAAELNIPRVHSGLSISLLIKASKVQFLLCIPVFNLLFASVIFFNSDKLYEVWESTITTIGEEVQKQAIIKK